MYTYCRTHYTVARVCCRCVAIDVDDTAVGIAQENASHLQLADRYSCIQLPAADLTSASFAPTVVEADIVIANLPYIPSAEMATLEPEGT